MERIFRSTPNGVLMAHTEWLPGVRLRHFSTICIVYIEDCEGWRFSGCRSSVTEPWLHKPDVPFQVIAGLLTFFYFRLKNTSSLFIPKWVKSYKHLDWEKPLRMGSLLMERIFRSSVFLGAIRYTDYQIWENISHVGLWGIIWASIQGI